MAIHFAKNHFYEILPTKKASNPHFDWDYWLVNSLASFFSAGSDESLGARSPLLRFGSEQHPPL